MKNIFLILMLTVSYSAISQNTTPFELLWEKIGELPKTNGKSLGFAGPIAGVHQDVFMVGGGANFPEAMPWLGGRKSYYDDLYLYRKNADGQLELFSHQKMPSELGYAACVSTPKGVLIAGGENMDGATAKVRLAKYDSGKVIFEAMPDLPLPLSSPAVTHIGNVVYLAGGENAESTSKRVFKLDLNARYAHWEELPSLPRPASHAVLVIRENGDLYLVGGRKKNVGKPSTLYKSVYKFDLENEKWRKAKSLPYALSAGTGSIFNDRYILMFGGDKGETFHKTEKLIFAIAKQKNDQKKAKLTEDKIALQSGHPGFTHQVLAFDLIEKKWVEAGEIRFDSPVTTTAVNWNGEIIIPGGEIRAGVRTPQIISLTIKP